MSKQSSSTDSGLVSATVSALYAEASALFDLSDRINQFWPVTWCCKGVMLLVKYEIDGKEESRKDLDRAKYYFNAAKKEGESLPSLLGLGVVSFLEGNYKESEVNFCSAIMKYPTLSGAGARVALGLSCYKLGQVDRAKACFDRAISIDVGNVEAIVGRAVLDLSAIDDTTEEGRNKVENAIRSIVTAPLNDKNNSMVNNHLANHFFYVYSAIPGSVTVNSDLESAACSDPKMDLRKGDKIRIGMEFECVVDGVTEGGTIRFNRKYPEGGVRANVTVYKHDYDKVLNFAKAGFLSTKVPAIKAESCWLMGRVYQVQGDYENAEKFYRQSGKLDSSFSPALFCYSQLLVLRKDYLGAVECLEKVLKSLPNSPDTLALLGFILAKDSNKRRKALRHLDRAIELNPKDPTIHMMYATVLRGSVVDFSKALEAYGRSIELLESAGEKVSPNTFNNIGVLNAWKSDFATAESSYIRAVEHMTKMKWKGSDDEDHIKLILESDETQVVSVIFNLSRLYEEMKQFEKAASIHKVSAGGGGGGDAKWEGAWRAQDEGPQGVYF